MTQNGLGYVYSNVNDKGHFGIPKVILSFNERQYPFNDPTGKYGMTQIVYGIPINNKKEGDEIVEAINSDTFKEIIKATKWNTFYTEWRMFKYFKRDFYKKFIEPKRKKNKTTSIQYNEIDNSDIEDKKTIIKKAKKTRKDKDVSDDDIEESPNESKNKKKVKKNIKKSSDESSSEESKKVVEKKRIVKKTNECDNN
jgi:hypothetical protein